MEFNGTMIFTVLLNPGLNESMLNNSNVSYSTEERYFDNSSSTLSMTGDANETVFNGTESDSFADYGDGGPTLSCWASREFYCWLWHLLEADLGTTLAVIGLILNASFWFTFYRQPSIRTSTNLYLLHLSFGDTIFLITRACNGIISWKYPSFYDYTSSGLLQRYCIAVTILTFLPSNMTLLILAAVSIERYIAICHPLRSARQNNKKLRTWAKISLLWIISLILTPTYVVTFCTDYTSLRLYFANTILDIVTCGITLMIVIVLYGAILVTMNRRNRKISQTDKTWNKHGTQITTLLLTTTILFFTLYTPYIVYSVFATMRWHLGIDIGITDDTLNTWYYASMLCLYINSTINPIVYKITSSHYWAAFKEAFGLSSIKLIIPVSRRTSHVELSQLRSSSSGSLIKK